MVDKLGGTKRATMMDVASVAGVSHQTVSRYLRFNGGLKEATKERIDAAIRELNYRPNLVARSMRTRRTGRLAVLVPAQSSFSPSRILAGASAVAHDAGFAMEVLSLDGGAEARTARMLELADSGQVEGILSLAPVLPASGQNLEEGAAIVVSADYDDEMRGIGELADGSPVAEMIEHLAGLGHRRFLHISGAPQFASARGRKQVYLDTIAGLGLESQGVFDGDWSADSGIQAAAALPADSGVTAVIAANDVVAAGFIKGARARGWRVPEDISVTGWDNNPLGALLTPTLTTVDVDHENSAATQCSASSQPSDPRWPTLQRAAR
jgi:LacI family transcriptional regulator